MRIKSLLLILFVLLGVWQLSAQSLAERVQITPIMVSITGMVDRPGQYPLTVHNRLSDALEIARNPVSNTNLASLNQTSLPGLPAWKAAQDSSVAQSQALRSIRLTRAGQSNSYDLLQFFRKGDLSQNPLLRDGDMIFVPGISQIVSLSGELYQPGDYEFLPNDNLGDMVQLAGGNKPAADLANLKLFRLNPASGRYELTGLGFTPSAANLQNIVLNPWDRVVIPVNSELRTGRKVSVQGQVRNPGEYFLSPGQGVYDALSMAGGPTQNADLASAIYLNQVVNEAQDLEFERLKLMTLSSMTSLEYSYLRAKLRQIRGRYSVDIAAIWELQGTGDDLELHNGDVIYVPERMNMIWVSGQVQRPGFVPYVPGADYRDYIAAAGGISRGARFGGTRVIEVDSGNWIKPRRNRSLMPGDTVFVPDRLERDFWTDLKDIVLVTTQMITIVVGVRALTN